MPPFHAKVILSLLIEKVKIMIFQSSKGPLYYECSGDHKAKPIVFLHALGSDHHMFDSQKTRFEASHLIIMVDLPWHGASYIPFRRLDFNEISEVLKELLDHLEVLDAVISGVSLGGYIAQHFAFRYPERIKAVHMDGAHPLHMGFNPFIKGLARIHTLLTYVLPKWMIYMMASVILSTDKPSRKLVRSHFRHYDRKHLIHLSEGAKHGLLNAIDHPLDIPMLMTIGEREFGFIRRRCERWADGNRTVVLQEITGGNHLHITQYPHAFEASLKAFVDTLPIDKNNVS